MYVWIGLSLNDELQDFSNNIIQYSFKKNIKTPLNALPIHISLRISFDIQNELYRKIEDEILLFAKSLKPFNVSFKQIEKNNNIIWLRCEDNHILLESHNFLCEILKEKHNIPYHEFDNNFIFHSTLFMDDHDKINKEFSNVSGLKFPKNININKMLLGTSENGEPGTFKVKKTIIIGV